jgi:hypothetical protein
MNQRRSAWLALASLALGVGALRAEVDAPEATPYRRVFVTSTAYNGDLGFVAGADAKCQARAAAAGLANSDQFVAWISDATTDAFCHAQGLAGKRSHNCGEFLPPTNAGPWIRVDGRPFAPRIDLALAPTSQILTQPALDEFGTEVDFGVKVWTATTGEGILSSTSPTPCSNWGSSSAAQDPVTIGTPWATSYSWTNSGGTHCDFLSGHLICLEKGDAAPWPPYRSGGALAFLTSVTGSGDLSSWPQSGGETGLAAGDAICRSLAAAAGLPAADTFVAWLSDGVTDAVNRYTTNGPWIRLDGVQVAVDRNHLSNALAAPIHQTETGIYKSNQGVWTGTDAQGADTLTDCLGWSSEAPEDSGTTGWANRASPDWTDRSTAACDATWMGLYCLADFSAFIFVDGFESADRTAWSSSTP